MMREKRIVPELRFLNFSGEFLKTNLSEIANIFDGTHQTPNYVEEGVPFVSVENISNLSATSKHITVEAFSKGFKTKPQKGDIFMTRITAGIIGATAIVENDAPLAYYVSLALIRVKSRTHVHFLSAVIATDTFKRELHKRIIHVAFPKKINLGEIGDCEVSIPSTYEEQQKIATFLTGVDRRIELLEKKKEKLEAYKKGVMQQLFSRQIRFKQDDGSDFPDWKEKKLGEVCEIVKGQQLNKSELSETGQYPAINGGIFPSGYTEDWNTSENTITISEGGNSCGFVNYQKTNFWSGGHCYSLLKISSRIESDFLFHILKYQQESIMALRVGSGLPNIQKKGLSKLKLSVPSRLEQLQIIELLNSLENTVSNLDRQITQTQTWKKGLLQQMFV